MKENVLQIPEIYDLYKSLKYESKFASLSMSEKLFMLQRIGEAFAAYRDAGKKLPISAEVILDNINERGFSRTKKVLDFCNDMQMKLHSERFSDKKSKTEFKEFWKEKIFGNKSQREKDRDILEG